MLQVLKATYLKNRIGIRRAVPWSFIISRVFNGITQILIPFFVYNYFLRGNLKNSFYMYTGEADYMTYVVLGAALNVLAVSTLMNIGRALITELREGTLETLLLSPASRTGYFFGCLAEQTSRALLEFLAVLFTGWLTGANLRYIFTFQTVFVIMFAILSFFCMGLTVSAIMLKTRDTYISQNTLFLLMNVMCGITFPIQYLPEWLQTTAQIIPLTPAVQLFRNVAMGGQGLFENLQLLVQIGGLCMIYAFIGSWWLKRKERFLVETIFG